MWTTILSIAFSIFKYSATKFTEKKLTDKEFVAFIQAYANNKANAGQTALDWEDALEQGQKELDELERAKAELARIEGDKSDEASNNG